MNKIFELVIKRILKKKFAGIDIPESVKVYDVQFEQDEHNKQAHVVLDFSVPYSMIMELLRNE